LQYAQLLFSLPCGHGLQSAQCFFSLLCGQGVQSTQFSFSLLCGQGVQSTHLRFSFPCGQGLQSAQLYFSLPCEHRFLPIASPEHRTSPSALAGPPSARGGVCARETSRGFFAKSFSRNVQKKVVAFERPFFSKATTRAAPSGS
jgi:hypothetical protein